MLIKINCNARIITKICNTNEEVKCHQDKFLKHNSVA